MTVFSFQIKTLLIFVSSTFAHIMLLFVFSRVPDTNVSALQSNGCHSKRAWLCSPSLNFYELHICKVWQRHRRWRFCKVLSTGEKGPRQRLPRASVANARAGDKCIGGRRAKARLPRIHLSATLAFAPSTLARLVS